MKYIALSIFLSWFLIAGFMSLFFPKRVQRVLARIDAKRGVEYTWPYPINSKRYLWQLRIVGLVELITAILVSYFMLRNNSY